MKQLHGNSVILGAAAFVFIAAQPASAQIAQVTGVKVNPANGGISVVLQTSSGSRPQVFTTKRGNALVSDIINTQLRLPQGNNFRQDNPAAGIAAVEVIQLDANSIRVMVTGSNNIPTNQPVVRKANELTLSFTPSATTASTATPSAATSAPATPDVLVPNPEVSIDGRPAPTASPSQPVSQAPPFLPRAVAPPVGDIAVSNTDASPSTIDLGTQERVPRLVLRDAPVREVLSLLARAAGMNLAYVEGEKPAAGGAATGGAAGQGQATSQTISLDIENEPVQDVFNYVLRLSGLEGNRSGRTIFVGTSLPNATRDVVMRSLRLNQVTVGVALNYLVGLGAESAVSRERQVTSVNAVPVGAGANPITQTQTTTETRLEIQRADFKDSKPLLRGLQALGDERTNSLTLIGTPRTVDMAMAQLTQLDIRRRQVAVNVRIIDVNLLNTQDQNASFSFGIGNNFFSSDEGAASLNFGGSRPATSTETRNSVTETPIIANPITGEPFLRDGFFNPTTGRPSASPPLDPNGNPTQPGITDFTPGRPGTTTFEIVPSAIDPVTGEPTAFRLVPQTTPATPDEYTFGLPSLFQYPKRLLASLQAQVQNGNAKILTDPTLIVQEGQTANVNLTQEVVGNITREIVRDANLATETITADKEQVGLTLAVKVDRIDDNGFVSLSVAPVVKAPVAPASINVGGGGSQQIFLVSERSLNSGVVRLRDGQTLILSGIIQDTDRTNVSKIPILGDIPLIGSLFRKTNRSNQRNEVIVLLTPQVMDDSENSAYGYDYTPSPEVRQMIERRGLSMPR
ncbi:MULTISPECIES: type IV pilus secretin family protein [unclassified Nodularia (in: cyanobacteria)]|uniref:AMIN domain-containing protein n=1 Tax=unclassified Nodularia (in: cyanobacteria) TaxID=2656917 RepID=UPI00187E8C8C|nr:type IV pilus secretin family protein [Nodularia sp. LEGE 06071]MBE9199008.1 AMIN domain-containing protein [Nodularia sp. LEGE 06071]MCC2695006.1 AMIN domain-containing protein [Nodularia sp. LEGE 04288]